MSKHKWTVGDSVLMKEKIPISSIIIIIMIIFVSGASAIIGIVRLSKMKDLVVVKNETPCRSSVKIIQGEENNEAICDHRAKVSTQTYNQSVIVTCTCDGGVQ